MCIESKSDESYATYNDISTLRTDGSKMIDTFAEKLPSSFSRETSRTEDELLKRADELSNQVEEKNKLIHEHYKKWKTTERKKKEANAIKILYNADSMCNGMYYHTNYKWVITTKNGIPIIIGYAQKKGGECMNLTKSQLQIIAKLGLPIDYLDERYKTELQ